MAWARAWAWLSGFALCGCSFLIDDSPLGCAPHRLCGDGQSLCVGEGEDAKCQPLKNADAQCRTTYPEDLSTLEGEDIFHIGMIVQRPTRIAENANYGEPSARAVQVAVAGINDRGGLPVSGARARKFLVIECNETPATDSEQQSGRRHLKSRVDHLVQTLRVPAIIGASTSGDTDPIITTYLGDSDTLLLSPSATDDALAAPRGGTQMFWRTVPPDSRQAPALKGALVVAQRGVTSSEPGAAATVFAVYDSDNPAGENLKIQLERDQAANFAATATYEGSDKATQDVAIRAILEAKPRIVMPFGTVEFVASMLGKIEDQWGSAPRPWYIMSEGNRTNFKPALDAHPDLTARVIGTAPGARSAQRFVPFQTEYREELGQSMNPGNLAECGYDAAYLIAYAATKASSGASWPGGGELVEAIQSLSCKDEPRRLAAGKAGFRMDVGRILANPDGCFDFEGVSGPVDYEPMTAGGFQDLTKESSDMALWCLTHPTDPDDQTANLTQYYYSQLDNKIVNQDPNGPELAVTDKDWCKKTTSLLPSP